MGTLLETINITTKQNTAFSTTIVPPDGYKLGHIHIVDSAGAESEIDVLPAQELSYLLSLPLPPQKIDVCVLVAERLVCMPTQMIQWTLDGGVVPTWGCYRVDVNTCNPQANVYTMSARRVKAGSSMKWTGSNNTPSGWFGTLGYYIQELTNTQNNNGNIGPSFPALLLQMHTPGGTQPYYYEYNPNFAGASLLSADSSVSADYEWLVLPSGQLQLKRNNVIIVTSAIALDIVNKEYVFGTIQDNSPWGCRSNFRFENMGATANWTVI